MKEKNRLQSFAFNQNTSTSEMSFSRHALLILLSFAVFYSLWFLPSLLKDQLLGPGDGYIQSLPAYYAPRTLWTTQLLGGFPVAADVTPQTWYPVSLLLSLVPKSWNAFVISSYVLASAFSYAYTYTITRSSLAGLVTGLIYGCSGFMMAHLGHTSMIHTATWIPLTILACEKLLRSNRIVWLVILSVSIACLFLAGHPQISVYGLVLLISYAASFGTLTSNRWLFYRQFIFAIVTGLGLAAIQLVPTAELAKMTPRAEMSFQDFLAYSMPLSHAVMAIFPYIFGGGSVFPYGLPRIGVLSPTEIPIYMGLLPLTLALVGVRTNSHPKSFRYFWAIVAIISFLLMLGATTPIAWMSFQIPGYNKFRIPSRHAIELAMSVSILAGLGIQSLQQQQWDVLKLKKLLRSSLVIMGFLTLWAAIVCSYFLQKKSLTTPQISLPFLSTAIVPSLVVFFLGWVSLFWYVQQRSTATVIVLLAILTIDLAAFGWFDVSQMSPPSNLVLPPPLFLKNYAGKMKEQSQRFLPIHGAQSDIHGVYSNISEAPPNLSRIWNAPNMSGYGPLMLSRVGEFMSLVNHGAIIPSASLLDSQNLSFDLASVRYLTTTAQPKFLSSELNSFTKWGEENLSVVIGKTCNPEPRQEVTIDLPEPVEIDSIYLVGSLGCSIDIAQGTKVLEVKMVDIEGQSKSNFLRAGQDLSESAINRADVASQVKHQAAKIFKQTPIPSETWLVNEYVAKVLLVKPSTVRQIKLNLPTENTGSVTINKISLNNSRSKKSYPLLYPVLGNRWKYIEDLESTRIYENRNVMPRAWLTSAVLNIQAKQVLTAVKTSKLPNGAIFNPRSTALIEEPIDFTTQIPDPSATVQVEFPTETQVRLQTHSTQPSFLVLSDVFYPGWEAHIDGKPAHIFQTNYIFRGLQLPSGDHTVSFSFRPKSFAIGCGISGASFALLLYLALTDRKSKPSASSHSS